MGLFTDKLEVSHVFEPSENPAWNSRYQIQVRYIGNFEIITTMVAFPQVAK